jgi:hypothetical protein
MEALDSWLRVGAFAVGFLGVVVFFHSILRVALLNRRQKDWLATQLGIVISFVARQLARWRRDYNGVQKTMDWAFPIYIGSRAFGAALTLIDGSTIRKKLESDFARRGVAAMCPLELSQPPFTSRPYRPETRLPAPRQSPREASRRSALLQVSRRCRICRDLRAETHSRARTRR